MMRSYLLTGQNVALVTDAGTPCLSDPGYRTVAAAIQLGREHGVRRAVARSASALSMATPVKAVPGPCAAAAAVSVAGFDTSAGFLFLGFLDRSGRDRQHGLQEVCVERARPVVLYEAPHRLLQTLRDLAAVLEPQTQPQSQLQMRTQTLALGSKAEQGAGSKQRRTAVEESSLRTSGSVDLGMRRRIAVCRELTKLHEETIQFDSVRDAYEYFALSVGDSETPETASQTTEGPSPQPQNQGPRGEFALVLDRPGPGSGEGTPVHESTDGPISPEEAQVLLQEMMDAFPSTKPIELIARIARVTGVSKKALYRNALGLSQRNG
jgi:16S rRNA C1402 (ribose-2'-O) methylase RsmI